MTAIVLTVAILAAVVAFAALYRWPVSYRVGTVTGTDIISREDLVKAVDDAASTWNHAAGRTVAWRLPIGRRVTFGVQFNESLQEYLTTLGSLQTTEESALPAMTRAQADASAVRLSWKYSFNNPNRILPPPLSTEPYSGKGLDFSKYRYYPDSPAGTNPTLADLKKYEKIQVAATAEWKKASDALEAFRKSSPYTAEVGSMDAVVTRTEASATTIELTCLPNLYDFPVAYILAKIVTHQFGHVLLGIHEYESVPTSTTAASLHSLWKLQVFGRRGQ